MAQSCKGKEHKMKYQITRHNEVGTADHGWLHAKHYFSFASYFDPKRMGFGKLRVINDDLIEPGKGFGTHPHKDMEIITIPQTGAVKHQDSGGNKGVIQKGEVQVMSAGKGILHSEYNNSESEQLGLFQIWIEPSLLRVNPRYDQQKFDYHQKINQWTQLISPIDKASEEGLKIHQNAYINGTHLKGKKKLAYSLKDKSNGLFLLVASGEIKVAGETLISRDAMAIESLGNLEIEALVDSEVLAIEVPLTGEAKSA